MALVRIWARALPLHFHGCDGARNWRLGGVLHCRSPGHGPAVRGHRGIDSRDLLRLWSVRLDPARSARAATLMADHSHPPTSKKVLVAVGGQSIDAETVRLACRITDPGGGRLYGVHIIEVNRSLPLGAGLDEGAELGGRILVVGEDDAAEFWVPRR